VTSFSSRDPLETFLLYRRTFHSTFSVAIYFLFLIVSFTHIPRSRSTSLRSSQASNKRDRSRASLNTFDAVLWNSNAAVRRVPTGELCITRSNSQRLAASSVEHESSAFCSLESASCLATMRQLRTIVRSGNEAELSGSLVSCLMLLLFRSALSSDILRTVVSSPRDLAHFRNQVKLVNFAWNSLW
jgi:hypothetical protein